MHVIVYENKMRVFFQSKRWNFPQNVPELRLAGRVYWTTKFQVFIGSYLNKLLLNIIKYISKTLKLQRMKQGNEVDP